MGITSTSLDLIRSVFMRDNRFPQPPEFMNQYFGRSPYLGTTSPLSDHNEDLFNSSVISNNLALQYADFDLMATYPEIGTALNIYADEATQADALSNRSLWIKSEDDTIEQILNNTLHKQLEIEDCIWEMAHDLTQYGNLFEELIVLDNIGVTKLIHHPAHQMRRIESRRGILYGFLEDEGGEFNTSEDNFMKKLKKVDRNTDPNDRSNVFEPWEMVHFRIRSSGRKNLYGTSAIEQARWAWKRLSWMEDAMVVYKLSRSPQRFVFYVDVGDVPPNEARKILNNYKQDFKKQKVVDEQGRLTFNFSPLRADQDFYIARRKGERSTEIDTLAGLEGQSTEDATYFRDKLISALGIPKAYLGYDETIGRSNLNQQDIRFAKSVMRIQRGLKNGFKHICQVDLAARNIDPDKVDFEVNMVVPSGALETAQIEILNLKAALAGTYQGLNFSEYYIRSQILGMTDDDIESEIKQREREQNPQSPASPQSAEAKVQKAKKLVSHKEKDRTNEILDHINQNNTQLSNRIQSLKGLINEIRLARPKR